jgi:hypothetical protein
VVEVSDELVVWLKTAADDEVERVVEDWMAELSTLAEDTAVELEFELSTDDSDALAEADEEPSEVVEEANAELVFEFSADEAEAEADDGPTEFVDEDEAALEFSSEEVRLVEDAAAELEEAGWLDELDIAAEFVVEELEIAAELETVELEIAAELVMEELDTVAELVEEGKAEFDVEELEIASLELEELDIAAELELGEVDAASLLLEDWVAELEVEELQGTVVHTTTGFNAAVTYDVTAMPPLIVNMVVEIVCEG